ncbi:MAG: ATP-binding cassette domain-containing protein [Elainella sp.]
MSSSNSLLRLEQISLKAAVGVDYLLQDISCEIFQNDCFGIVGASGSGKTTLLRVINRLVEANHGQIFFEGHEIRQIPVIDLRRQITLVPQETRLLGMTVRQAMAYPLLLREVERPMLEQRLQTVIELLQIPSDWMERTETQLSVGQRQLIGIGRALVIRPRLLLLDEPTSALDAGRGTHLVQVLRSLAQTTSLTVVMVNHQLDLMQQFCSQLLWLRQGRIALMTSASRVDWGEVKQGLVDANQQEAEDWG